MPLAPSARVHAPARQAEARAAAAERAPAASAHAAPARLLAVRIAGGAFHGPCSLRSVRLEALLSERARLRRALEEARGPLVDALHAAVPAAADAEERRLLLRLKRDVFNGRATAAPPAGLAPALAARVDGYARLAAREAALLDAGRAAVVEECRARIAALLADPGFRLAAFHASPDLREEVEHAGAPSGPALTSLERGVAAYAARFISKANPLHLFGRVLFPPASGLAPDGDHELVLDAGGILALERRRLAGPRDPRRVRVSLCTHTRDEGAYRFWIPSPEGFRVAVLRAHPPLDALVALLAGRGPVVARPAAEAHLRAQGAEGGAAAAFLDRLAAAGVLNEHLVADFGAFAPALAHGGDALEAQSARLQRWHLARISAAELPAAAAALDAERMEDGRAPACYVNSYASGDASPHERAAAEVADDLRELAPCFAVQHNVSAHAYVLRAAVQELVGGAPGAAVPYLALLRHWIAHHQELLARFHPSAHRGTAERRRLAAFTAAAGAAEGRLERPALARLAEEARALAPAAPLCFNGPFDYVDRVYHVQNVFAGGGRFTARYLLHRGADPAPGSSAEGEVLDVELALPPHPAMNYVVRRHAAGCGFEARYAERYDRWIEPAEVAVALEDGEVAYRHAPTGRRLRFHHSGFMLGQFLAAEYQLLLAGHADAYLNPFAGEAPATGAGGVGHRPGVRYGAVSLRRERWSVRRPLLAPFLAEGDALRGAAWLRDWVHGSLREADLWYCRAAGTGPGAHKPRLLDLLNPFSVQAFRRELAAGGEVATLTVMDPPPAHLHRAAGGAYVTELMIEV